jgi:predicted nucleic acid-binding protein
MSGIGAVGLFVDTGPFYARFVSNAPRHERASGVFDRISEGTLRYRPLYTSTYILDELATLLIRRSNASRASEALRRIRSSPSISILHPGPADFEAACTQLERYEDHDIEFTDHMSGVLSTDRAVGHVFTFDPTDFRTLGFTIIPDDTGSA